MKDVVQAVVVLLLVASVLVFARQCMAGEWFPEAAIFVDVTSDESIYCHGSSHEAAHLGARVDLWGSGRHSIRTLWVHNSCVQEGSDKEDRNVIGVGYELRLW